MIRRFERTAVVVFLFAILTIGTELPAKGYTDPGTGALIWQTMVAAFVGVLFYSRRAMSWFKNRKGPKD